MLTKPRNHLLFEIAMEPKTKNQKLRTSDVYHVGTVSHPGKGSWLSFPPSPFFSSLTFDVNFLTLK